MSSFLINKDYESYISEDELNVIASNEKLLRKSELTSIEIVKSKISHRYDVTEIFKELKKWDISTLYEVGDSLYYEELPFDLTATYNQHDRVNYEGFIYEANQRVSAGLFDSTKWDYVCDNQSIYECFSEIDGVLPTDIEFFEEKDTRSQLIMKIVIILTMVDLFMKISPRNIPETRFYQKEWAEKELTAMQKPMNNYDLPLLLEDDGVTVKGLVPYGGGMTKQNHQY